MVFLSPRSDMVFKKLFGTPANRELTISFLNSVLELPEGKRIVNVEFNDPNNHLETLRQKFSIVDIRCTDERGYQYIIEMQNQDYHNFAQRAQYYSSCGISVQLQVAEEYQNLLPIIFVGIVNYTLFPRHDRYLTHHYTLDIQDQYRDLDLTAYHFIELPKFKKEITQDDSLIDKWIYFLKHAEEIEEIPSTLQNTKPFSNAFHVLTQSAWTMRDLALYKQQVDTLRVEKGVLKTAEMKGREEGRDEGRDERSLEVARNMLAEGIDKAIIAKITGLTADVIQKLKKDEE